MATFDDGFDINDHDFPLLSSKPTARDAPPHKGRRVPLDAKSMKDVTLEKTVVDQANLLGKRRKARLLSECDQLSSDVVYSLNRKNRWSTVDAESLLAGAAAGATGQNVSVAVVEGVARKKNGGGKLARALHTLNADWSIASLRPTKRGGIAHAASLFARHREEEESKLDDDDVTSPSKPTVVYTINRPHPNARIAAAKTAGKGMRKRTSRRAGAFIIDADDMLTSTSDIKTSLHEDAAAASYRRSREASFCLGDYIVTGGAGGAAAADDAAAAASEAIRVEKPTEESVIILSDGVDVEKVAKPFDLLDISAIKNVPYIFKRHVVETKTWKDFDFEKEVESLRDHASGVRVRWLDANRQRASVELSPSSQGNLDGHPPHCIVVLEKTRRTQQRIHVTVNMIGGQACAPSLNSCGSIAALLEAIAARANRVDRTLLRDFYARIHDKKSTRSSSPEWSADASSADYACSRLLSSPSLPLRHDVMAQLIRDHETRLSVADDGFERLLDEEWQLANDVVVDSEEEDDEPVTVDDDVEDIENGEFQVVPRAKIQCASCVEMAPEALFETESDWRCRRCLEASVISQIKQRQLPVKLDLVCHDDSSPYDVLPALVPLPLILFYTNQAAREILSDESPSESLQACPACFTLLRVEHPCIRSSAVCANCSTHFCTDCDGEPHWPLVCDEHAAWTAKFSQQYKFEVMREQTDQCIKRISCTCGSTTDVGDKADWARCACGMQMNPRTMKRVRDFQPICNNYIKRGALQWQDMSLPEGVRVESLEVVRLIKRPYASVAADARKERLSNVASESFEKYTHKMFGAPEDKRVNELRKASLLLLEHGTAAAYVRRVNAARQPPLRALRNALDALTRDVIEVDATATLRARVADLEAAYAKAIEFFN